MPLLTSVLLRGGRLGENGRTLRNCLKAVVIIIIHHNLRIVNQVFEIGILLSEFHGVIAIDGLGQIQGWNLETHCELTLQCFVNVS